MSQFFIGTSVCRDDWLIAYVVELSLRVNGYCVTQSLHHKWYGRSFWCTVNPLPWDCWVPPVPCWVVPLAETNRCDPRAPPSMTKILLWFSKIQEFISYVPRAGTNSHLQAEHTYCTSLLTTLSGTVSKSHCQWSKFPHRLSGPDPFGSLIWAWFKFGDGQSNVTVSTLHTNILAVVFHVDIYLCVNSP